jgi:hypothetical protein
MGAGNLAAVIRVAAGLLLALALAAPASAQGPRLLAGAGRADITPPNGYFTLGWVRGDSKPTGVSSRLYARAIVLRKGEQKLALVAVDLAFTPGGLAKHAAEAAGFTEDSVLFSASHTHSGPGQISNFPSYNFVAPTQGMPDSFNFPGPPDQQLYAFMVRRIAQAIRRADNDVGPAVAAWGRSRIVGLTKNRSIEAHLANHGIVKAVGTGSEADDPHGYPETVNPDVDVLRVDKLAGKGRRRRPIGAWSTFSAHGTTIPYTWKYWNADHHASAARVFERKVRRAGRVPRSQEVVNAFGNTDEGDISAALDTQDAAWGDHVGRVEAKAMLRAWRRAGRGLRARPAFGARWTRVCFCGQETPAGVVADSALFGQPQLTGSEEGRGPLYEVTQTSFEGNRLPAPVDPHGYKIPSAGGGEDVPNAVPLFAVRLGERVLVSVPGEMSAGMGRRVREAVRDATGVPATIAGLANEYLSYFVTPEEYDQQHYEGASTLYGRATSVLIQMSLVDLAQRLVRGEPAPDPHPFDPANGVTPDGAPFPLGAQEGQITAQPQDVERLQHASFAWRGGERGFDRPLDAAFIRVERRGQRRWARAADDLGMAIAWNQDDENVYRARWEVPLHARAAAYRFVVTANHYRLVSEPFRVRPATDLRAQSVPGGLRLLYPVAVPNVDFNARPEAASGGRITYTLDGRRRTRKLRRGQVFRVPAGASVAAGAVRDRYGNRNASAVNTGA